MAIETLFIALETFGPKDGDAWVKYVEWSGLTQLDELVSLDQLLCPTTLPEMTDAYWPHVASPSSLLTCFTNLEFLKAQIESVPDRNLLCILQNPDAPPRLPPELSEFELLGYDLLDGPSGVSALTNCGGFPEAFENSELSSKGLIVDHARALAVQAALPEADPGESHAYCDLWAIIRSVSESPREVTTEGCSIRPPAPS